MENNRMKEPINRDVAYDYDAQEWVTKDPRRARALLIKQTTEEIELLTDNGPRGEEYRRMCSYPGALTDAREYLSTLLSA